MNWFGRFITWSKKLSNCHFRAWKRFRTGEAEWICFRRTRYSKLHKYSKRWWYSPIKYIVAPVFYWSGSALAFVGIYLEELAWYHVAYVTPDGVWREFVPFSPKKMRYKGPIIFQGKEQNIPDK